MLLAVALLGFVLLGITPLFVASVKSNYSANEYTSINMLARDRLERLMNMPFDSGISRPAITAPATWPPRSRTPRPAWSARCRIPSG